MKFHQRFTNVDIGTDEARRRFTSRMLYAIFPRYPNFQGMQLQLAARALGEPVIGIQTFAKVIQGDFYRLLDVLERLIAILGDGEGRRGEISGSELSTQIEYELNSADIDLEIEWRDGKFYPTGARLLDAKLIDDPLEWLKNHELPSVYEPLTKALEHLLQGRKDPRFLADAITNAYDALEAMAIEVCGRETTFDANREQFVSSINASDEFKRIGKEIAQYAHAFRHGASEQRPKPKPSLVEVESYIYTVGLLIRLSTESLRKA